MAEDNFDPFDADAEAAASTVEQAAAVDQGAIEYEKLRVRKDAYVRFFAGVPIGDDIKVVRDDIKKFCRGEQTPWHEDARVHALLCGRNEVYQRIMQHINLDMDALVAVLSGKAE